MTLEAVLSAGATAFKFPFFQIFKLFLITPLNFIPTNLREIHGLKGYGADNRPDLREFHTVVRGERRLHLGCALIAHLRGVIIKRQQGVSPGENIRGVYTEDFQAIREKWTY